MVILLCLDFWFADCVMIGDTEKSLAISAFKDVGYCHPPNADPNLLDLGNLVSRKKDFVPAITKAIKSGWAK